MYSGSSSFLALRRRPPAQKNSPAPSLTSFPRFLRSSAFCPLFPRYFLFLRRFRNFRPLARAPGEARISQTAGQRAKDRFRDEDDDERTDGRTGVWLRTSWDMASSSSGQRERKREKENFLPHAVASKPVSLDRACSQDRTETKRRSSVSQLTTATSSSDCNSCFFLSFCAICIIKKWAWEINRQQQQQQVCCCMG